ncbi:MAG: hypothetical protein KBT46_04810, partial [Ruminococcus sp.]|nr:hypothetical protein [Candidatus Copronaster equi]
MEKLTQEEIKKYLPELKAVFYAAGTVGYFAEPFLNCGVRVFSAAYANGIPVAEYTVSQILLATKGYFQSAKTYKFNLHLSRKKAENVQGNYMASIGIVGLGVIGSMVAEKLKNIDAEVFAYDPFAKKEYAESLGVELCDLKTLFSKCDVISNHLANKKELNDIFNYELFSLMKPNATFINTGRGAQVNEADLAKALRKQHGRTAVLDVLKNENFPLSSPLWWCSNAIMTPHIAGSTGYEVTRLADYIIDEFNAYLNGGELKSEVTSEKLKTMA